MNVIYYVGVSVDGYIAGKNDDMEWLATTGVEMADTNYDVFYNTVDGLVMGRHTYDMIASFGQWPYGDKCAWVATTQGVDSVTNKNIAIEKNIKTIYDSALNQGLRNLWLVGGGKLASCFLAEKLLTDVQITTLPILLGGGVPVFSVLKKSVLLQQQDNVIVGKNFTHTEYKIKYT